MQPGTNKENIPFNNKLLLGLLACMVYRIITISLSVIYTHFFEPHKIHISTNIFDFYSYLFLVLCVFIVVFISKRSISIVIAIGSTLLMVANTFNDGLPYRALLFMFSALLAYLFIFMSNFQLKKTRLQLVAFKYSKCLKCILLIFYPFYIVFEKEMFRNVSLFIACSIFLVLFISWLNRRLQ